MTTGNISSADISKMMMNVKVQSNIISSEAQGTGSFQSLFGSQNSVETDFQPNKFENESIQTVADKNSAGKAKDIMKTREDTVVDDKAYNELKEDIKGVLKEELGLTDEELENAMAELGLTYADLLVPQNISNLIALVNNIEPAAIITDAQLTAQLADILGSVSELVNQFAEMNQINVQDVAGEFENFLALAEENADVTENNVSVSTVTDSETGKEITITVENARTEDVKTEFTKNPENTMIQDTAADNTQNNSDAKDSKSGNENSQSFAGNLINNLVENVAGAIESGSDFSQIYHVNSADVINQMIDSIRLNATVDTTQMEIQLTPENLGKINLTIAAKDGVITASITTANEAVKAIIESQLVQLKEAMNNQGLKVEDVEVTVANQAFDQNAENSGGDNGAQSRNTSRKFRGIDELSQDNTEQEDSIINQMMEANGNSVNLRA